MATPIISTTDQAVVRGSEESGGRSALVLGTPAALRFSVESSGVDSPYVSHLIDWGDGDTDRSGDFLPTGRSFQYTHDYREIGEYTVTIRATNKDGEVSAVDSFAVLAIRIDPLPSRQVRPFKWRGLALPTGSIKSALQAVEDSFPLEVIDLAVTADAGQRQLVFAAQDLRFAKDATITITQPDRLITAARIISTDSNVAVLDTDLNDSYDPGRSRVEVARRDISRRYTDKPFKPVGWFFPVTADEDLIKASVSMILATRQGERVFRPDVGSRIHELPFEQNDNVTGSQAKAYVPDEIDQQEPRAEVRRVFIDSLEGDAELWIRVELAMSTGEDTTFNVSVPLRGGFDPTAAGSASSF